MFSNLDTLALWKGQITHLRLQAVVIIKVIFLGLMLTWVLPARKSALL